MSDVCPECGKPLIGGSCIYCELKKGLFTEPERPKVQTETPRPEPKREVPPRQDPRAEPAPKTEPRPEPRRDEQVRREPGRPAPNMRVSCTFPKEIVTSGGGNVKLCDVRLENEGEQSKITIRVLVDGVLDSQVIKTVSGHGTSSIAVESGGKRFRVEYGVDLDLTVEVLGVDESLLHRQSSTVRLRPMFDVRLKDIKTDIPQWVTPNAKEIKDLIAKGGPVLNALERSGYGMVTGYQGSDPGNIASNVMKQMAAAYDGIRSLKLDYVSDVKSLGNNLTYNFQRVKLPAKVLEEGTGNCIELSCLFAAVFEAMGLYPVIVFPPGHAMVGVVISSDILPSVRKMHFKEEPPIFGFPIKDVGDGHGDKLQAIFLEATCVCGGKTDFNTALGSAFGTLQENRDRILKNEDLTVVQYRRRFSGKKPMNG